MRISIQNPKSTVWGPIDITDSIVSEVTLDERLDQVLDSGTFSFLSRDFTEAIEPFTWCCIDSLNCGGYDPESFKNTKWFYCTSNCNKYLTVDGLYYHEVQLYEPTKILECFILGTKTFSASKSKSNLSTDIIIGKICDIIKNKYGVKFQEPYLDTKVQREFSFGPGTTMYDALCEILKPVGCLPKLNSCVSDGTNYLSVKNISALKSSTIVPIAQITKHTTTQSVDDYCSEMETEMAEVVDRDTVQTCTLSCRSQGDVISKDTGCLITPSNMESLKKLYVRVNDDIQGTRMILLPKTAVDQALTGAKDTEVYNPEGTLISVEAICSYDNDSFLNHLKTVDNAVYNELINFLDGLNITLSQLNIGVSSSSGYDYSLIIYKDSTVQVDTDTAKLRKDYYLVVVDGGKALDNKSYLNTSLIRHNAWVELTPNVLNKEEWSMLNAVDQPKYLYWETGGNYITGFYNTYNNGFWYSLIYGQVAPFFESLVSENTSGSKYFSRNQAQLYWNIIEENINNSNFQKNANTYQLNQTIPLFYRTKYLNYTGFRVVDSGLLNVADKIANDNTEYLNNVYKVQYYTKSPVLLRTEKSTYKCHAKYGVPVIASKSYNNGASTVDFDQLVPALQRAVDMQGLPITTIYSKDNVEVGTRIGVTQKDGSVEEAGYVISKVSTFRQSHGQLYSSFVYNCSPNYEQIAAAIGVETQYEATNVPQTGIVDRFIYIEHNKDLLYDDFDDLYLIIKEKNNNYLAKPMQHMSANGTDVLICEMADNYCFDYAMTDSSQKNYKSKEPVKTSAFAGLPTDYYIGRLKNNDVDTLKKLPRLKKADFYPFIEDQTPAWHKDGRERLVLVFKLI